MPRILGNMDRNPFSLTYGCMHRDYWFYKTSDFPDAVRQFATHAIAIAYKYELPDNIYFGNEKVKDWAIASLDFLTKIQHNDGSFDEFYPFQRGWAGPTAYVTYSSIESLRLLKDDISSRIYDRILNSIRKSANFIISYQQKNESIANHHAIACLAVWSAYELFDDVFLKKGYKKLWDGFLRYQTNEGWSVEADGLDPGYLTATISFLAKLYQKNQAEEIFHILQKAIDICSYFVYPDGSYSGGIGSRETMHFYPHGFELMAERIPLAGSIAELMLKSLSEDKLVPPENMSDRYVGFRIPEFLQAYLDYTPVEIDLPPVPYQREPFVKYLPESKVYVKNSPVFYFVANLAKGGVIKVFDKKRAKIVCNDCGWTGVLKSGELITSQFGNRNRVIKVDEYGIEIKGRLSVVPSGVVFNLHRNLFFRLLLLCVALSTRFSFFFSGLIRKKLMVSKKKVPIVYRRRVSFKESEININDGIEIEKPLMIKTLFLGGEFSFRNIPQSRYFQAYELETRERVITDDELAELNKVGKREFTRTINIE